MKGGDIIMQDEENKVQDVTETPEVVGEEAQTGEAPSVPAEEALEVETPTEESVVEETPIA